MDDVENVRVGLVLLVDDGVGHDVPEEVVGILGHVVFTIEDTHPE